MKIRAVLLSLICFALVFLPQVLNKSLIFKRGESYTIYSGALSSNAKITVCEKGSEWFTKLTTSNVTGESVCYCDSQTAFSEAERLGAKILFCEKIENVTCYFAYTPRVKNYVTLYGHRVNIQIAVSENRSKIGSPLIFGSY